MKIKNVSGERRKWRISLQKNANTPSNENNYWYYVRIFAHVHFMQFDAVSGKTGKQDNRTTGKQENIYFFKNGQKRIDKYQNEL